MNINKYRDLVGDLRMTILETVGHLEAMEEQMAMASEGYKKKQRETYLERQKTKLQEKVNKLVSQYNKDRSKRRPEPADFQRRLYEALAIQAETAGMNEKELMEWYKGVADSGDPVRRSEADRLIGRKLLNSPHRHEYQQVRQQALTDTEREYEAHEAALQHVEHMINGVVNRAHHYMERIERGDRMFTRLEDANEVTGQLYHLVDGVAQRIGQTGEGGDD